jgi:hypothetical protein
MRGWVSRLASHRRLVWFRPVESDPDSQPPHCFGQGPLDVGGGEIGGVHDHVSGVNDRPPAFDLDLEPVADSPGKPV